MRKFVVAVVDSQHSKRDIELEIIHADNEEAAIKQHSTIIAAFDDEKDSLEINDIEDLDIDEFCSSLEIYINVIEIR